MKTLLCLGVILLAAVATAAAHVGSPDVYFEDHAGPYPLLVVVRMPAVVPGVAEIEVHALSDNLSSVHVVPTRIRGLGAELAPVPDLAERDRNDRKLFRAQLWIMLRGAWKVQITVEGDKGKGELSVPLAAAPTAIRSLEGPLKWLLSGLMVLLVTGLAGMAGAAVREGMSDPGTIPVAADRRRARIATVCAALLVVAILAAGGWWWKAEAAAAAQSAYSIPHVTASLTAPDLLSLKLENSENGQWAERIRLDDLVPDHGHLVHLFLFRLPDLDQMYHLHPRQDGTAHFAQAMPALPAGRYQMFADIVHATGFPETQIGEITLPEIHGGALQGDDSSWAAMPLNASISSDVAMLGGGGRMLWLHDAPLRAGEPLRLRFRVEDGSGQPAADLEPYMGMPGHLVLISNDAAVFAHLHAGGSPPMATVELANGPARTAHSNHFISAEEITFPYGFPRAGTYRLFVQIKRAGRIETAVFKAAVGN